MTTKPKKTKKKAGKTHNQLLQEQLLQGANDRIAELAAALVDSERFASNYRDVLVRKNVRIDQLENHARELRSYMVATWRVNDLLRDMVTGARQMPDGRSYRDHYRDELVGEWTRIVPEVQETNLNEDGPER